ncbi:MAG: hypothetical protein A3H69_01985 [Candidatus Sungbacteria bacterium RIFCSPLOWO2_02_FULL_47_9]|uniref:Acylneuraminate cytidylyltransferase n=1 Tax=Candidatus Sungbacteria bacterium RIFCSPHIGHO2_01_FULL_47_32 TaxID=1802264 RepID=A0A1G2K7E7_9BACT|nr:MAG: CMP-N-acetylneuraminic acid synthetase [Parcubacteria group bacterium GW2011_GWA2_47_10]OGZ95123.1 MAG: hypothetical protein A2633_06340 [Candidatus Sungbacteria bacterium RIFCSPHIGHO2_01_FULL_47_32]OGZ98196.1 MAG: hypothetical protein A3D57_03205 [Candidatus Sungbacteria bacterium RIFCSPHIGHO2_02_FULL_46_12]OHA05603.1 MAG: hypothetical protein A3A28_00335 [Candidatus Sungbacteria bacterium RIFCSPLOWO2_01_FULL_47_32]OHA12274.1 MAG: hypothetical protein A3H69_01985 [Candidatus Sungbacter
MSQKIHKKILGVITARGGSKGIPGKNIKLLAGKPLIAYSIDSANESGAFDRLICSTDDEAIAAVAREHGCEVPFLRPSALALDQTPHLPVMQHAVRWLRDSEGYVPDYVMILQPTSPLRRSFHIRESAELILHSDADSVISVAELPDTYHPSYNLMKKREDGGLILLDGTPMRNRIQRRQDVPPVYKTVGMIFLFKTELLYHPEAPNFYGDKVMPYVVEHKYIPEIDIPADFEAAERAIKDEMGGAV